MYKLARMTIQNIVKALLESGFSQRSLAKRLSENGCETSQPTIARIADDESYQTGSKRALALLSIYQQEITDKAA